MGLVVGLVCLLIGAGDPFGNWLFQGYRQNGFPEMSVLEPASPASLVVLVIFTMGSVFAIEGTPGGGRRTMLLLSGMVVFAMASPVLALWGVFWNPFVLLVVVFWSGMMTMLHASNRDKAEGIRIAEERNVVRMNTPTSPSQHRSRKSE